MTDCQPKPRFGKIFGWIKYNSTVSQLGYGRGYCLWRVGKKLQDSLCMAVFWLSVEEDGLEWLSKVVYSNFWPLWTVRTGLGRAQTGCMESELLQSLVSRHAINWSALAGAKRAARRTGGGVARGCTALGWAISVSCREECCCFFAQTRCKGSFSNSGWPVCASVCL